MRLSNAKQEQNEAMEAEKIYCQAFCFDVPQSLPP